MILNHFTHFLIRLFHRPFPHQLPIAEYLADPVQRDSVSDTIFIQSLEVEVVFLDEIELFQWHRDHLIHHPVVIADDKVGIAVGFIPADTFSSSCIGIILPVIYFVVVLQDNRTRR